MLARRSLCQTAASRLARRHAAAAATAVALPSAGALTTARRGYVGEALVANLGAHCTNVAACTSLSTVLYSPLGTAMMLVLAYNVAVIGTKHVNYTMEITAKDYVQDQQLYVIMRYGILSCILLGMEVLFVEV